MDMGDISPEGLHIASTERMVQLVAERPAKTFIVATETGIMHRMEQLAPEKTFLAADRAAVCAYMKTITLESVLAALERDQFHVTVPPEIAARARASVDRMVALGAGGKPGD
jgi:quinolinate synthase